MINKKVINKEDKKTDDVPAKKEARPDMLDSTNHKINTGCGTLHLTVCYDKGKPQEVYGHISRNGTCNNCFVQALTEVITLALKAGVEVEEISELFDTYKCPRPHVTHQFGTIYSCPDAIAKVLRLEIETGLQSPKKSAK